MNKRGPQTSDTQRAKAAFRKASRALGERPTAKEIKAVSRLAKAAFHVELETRQRAGLSTRLQSRAEAPPALGHPTTGMSAAACRARLADLAATSGRAHLGAELALRRDLEATVAPTRAPGQSLEQLVVALMADETLQRILEPGRRG